jgi:hypothetical protein
MAYDLLFSLIKDVEIVLLKAGHEMVLLIRNRNRDQHQIDSNLDGAAIAF